MRSLARFIIPGVALASWLAAGSAGAEEKYICVWRNPERTMRRIFPQARDYRTVTRPISAAAVAAIEAKAGGPLLPGQREQYQYYEMLDAGGKRLGAIIAASQKGEYGAIEFVFGLDLSRSVNGIYIQRARERDGDFKKREFLDSLLGRGPGDLKALDALIGEKRTTGKVAVVTGLKKELAAFAELAP
ncbi:MAG: hypothetical protein AAB152_10215 [Candidatus Coatesbacteria bacterium]